MATHQPTSSHVRSLSVHRELALCQVEAKIAKIGETRRFQAHEYGTLLPGEIPNRKSVEDYRRRLEANSRHDQAKQRKRQHATSTKANAGINCPRLYYYYMVVSRAPA